MVLKENTFEDRQEQREHDWHHVIYVTMINWNELRTQIIASLLNRPTSIFNASVSDDRNTDVFIAINV